MKVIIVGAGYAGLFTALRLRIKGYEVTVIDQALVGSGPSGKNHGILHSGALYSILHPEIVPTTIAAQPLYKKLFNSARIETKPSIYIASKNKTKEYMSAWDATNISHQDFDISQLDGIMNANSLAELQGAAIDKESTYSNYEMLQLLVSYCLDVGVKIATGVSVKRVVVENSKVMGIELDGASGLVAADIVIMASGLGTRKFMEEVDEPTAQTVKSRVDMMVVFKSKGPELDRNIMVSEFGGPTLAPGRDGWILCATYGCPQPNIDYQQHLPVPYMAANNQVEQLKRFLHEDFINVDSVRMYMCSKTEYADPVNSDAWGVSPGSKVFDMAADRGIAGLWSILPGKMTLSMDASRVLVEKLTGAPEEAEITLPFATDQYVASQAATALVATPPWLL